MDVIEIRISDDRGGNGDFLVQIEMSSNEVVTMRSIDLEVIGFIVSRLFLTKEN